MVLLNTSRRQSTRRRPIVVVDTVSTSAFASGFELDCPIDLGCLNEDGKGTCLGRYPPTAALAPLTGYAGSALAKQDQNVRGQTAEPTMDDPDRNIRNRHSRNRRKRGLGWRATWIRNQTMARKAPRPAVSLLGRQRARARLVA